MNVMASPVPLLTGQRIVATMGLIQDSYGHTLRAEEFNYNHILRDSSWLSDCRWMLNESKSVKHGFSYLIVYIQ